MESHSEIDQAREHLRQAARAFGERLVGNDTAHHLRQATRHALLAGVAAIDRAEASHPASEAPTATPPATPTTPADGGCCGAKSHG